MFGDEPIFGQTELKIDGKGRIFIPANTKREPGEELILMYNEVLKVHEVYSLSMLTKRFEEINELILNSKTKKDKIFYEKMLCELSKSILKSSKIDSQGRMLIGSVFEGEEKINCTGAYDHLIIEPIKKK